jgi:signal peptidase I
VQGSKKKERSEQPSETKENQNVSRKQYVRELRKTILILAAVFAGILLLAMFAMPVFRITGNTMNPTLDEGNIVLSIRTGNLKEGDLAAIRYSDKILVRRVIGLPGDRIEMDESGTVRVNGKVLAEDYVNNPAAGQTDLTYPFVVPEGQYFMMGDNRNVSIDSRNSAIGCIPEDMIAGKLMMSIFPLNEIKALS